MRFLIQTILATIQQILNKFFIKSINSYYFDKKSLTLKKIISIIINVMIVCFN